MYRYRANKTFLWMLLILPVSFQTTESVVVVAETSPTSAVESPEGHPLLFERDIVPIFNAYCVHCHGWVYRKGDLDLRSLPLVLQGGKSGPAIERGSAEQSLLYQKIAGKEMPPTGDVKQALSGKDFIVANVVPTKEHLHTIATWINAGAPARYQGGPVTTEQSPPLTDQDRQWWAFQKKSASVGSRTDLFANTGSGRRRVAANENAGRCVFVGKVVGARSADESGRRSDNLGSPYPA